jgi:hypothetical protein
MLRHGDGAEKRLLGLRVRFAYRNLWHAPARIPPP